MKKVGMGAVKADVVARIYADSFNSNPLTDRPAENGLSECKWLKEQM